MRIFKNVDEKLKEIGFNKICEDKHGAQYERYNTKYNYWQCVDIWHKVSGRHILQSYDRDLMDEKKIGNTCVGLTGYEMKLFLKKMKKLGLIAKLRESRDSMAEKNNKEPSPCSGCKYEKSTNIKELLAFCTHCKRAYSHEEDREIHEDRYEVEESEG